MENKNIEYIKPSGIFTNYIFKAIPLAFDESMSYYETLCALLDYLKTTTNVVNNNAELLKELESYVNNYFDNLDVQEEINNKLDEMAESGELGEIIGDYLQQKVDYYIINSETTEDEIIQIFGVNRAKVISFETGEYLFTKDIIINSNTTVLLNGSSLKTNTHNKIIAYSPISSFTAYNGNSNIKISNGFSDFMLVFMHNTNVVIDNIEFSIRLLDHAIQIAGCKNIKIKNCKFYGSAISQNGNNQEMIQLETCTYEGQPYLDQDSVSYDNYGNFNIEITNNEFKKGDGINTQNYVCIGHHSKNASNEYCNENIIIKNNIFRATKYSAIRPVGFNHCIIEENTFYQDEEISGHIIIRPSWKNKNLTIRNNIFNGGVGAITNVNVEQNDNYLIDNNKILMTYTGTAMYLQSLTNSKIINNYIEYQKNAIGTAETTGLTMDNMTISNNSFISKLDTTDNYALNIYKCSNLVVTDNYCYQISDFAFIFYRGTTDKLPLYYANNYVYNANFNPNDVNGTNIVYDRIYNSLRRLHQANNATYTAITNQTVSWKFTEFNKAKLIVAKNGDASHIIVVEIAPYEMFAKLSKNRNYDITSNVSGTLHYATFSITDDNKFSYSGDGSLTLIGVYAYNELQI